MRNADPGVSIVSAQRPNSDFNSMFPVQITGHDSNASPILVFQRIHPFGCDDSSFLGREYSRQALEKNCSSVSFVMKYCLISTTCVNLASIQNLLTLFSCESNLIRSSNRCNKRFWCDEMSFSKGISALISLRTIDCPINTSSCLDLF